MPNFIEANLLRRVRISKSYNRFRYWEIITQNVHSLWKSFKVNCKIFWYLEISSDFSEILLSHSLVKYMKQKHTTWMEAWVVDEQSLIQ